MRRSALTFVPVLLIAFGGALLGFGCSTYRQDLDRARAHYDHNEYEAALALFR